MKGLKKIRRRAQSEETGKNLIKGHSIRDLIQQLNKSPVCRKCCGSRISNRQTPLQKIRTDDLHLLLAIMLHSKVCPMVQKGYGRCLMIFSLSHVIILTKDNSSRSGHDQITSSSSLFQSRKHVQAKESSAIIFSHRQSACPPTYLYNCWHVLTYAAMTRLQPLCMIA